MDHVVYLDFKAKEMELILNHSKSMIVRGATGRKIPYGRVREKDVLYFINNNGEGEVKARALVKSVLNSEKLSPEESSALIEKNMSSLKLDDKQLKKWSGKRYLVLIEITSPEPLKPFGIDKSEYSNMDDWLPVEDINSVKKERS